jgi:hypothetical protein
LSHETASSLFRSIISASPFRERAVRIQVIADGDTVVFEQRMADRQSMAAAMTIAIAGYLPRKARARRIHEYMDAFRGYRMIFGDEPPRSRVGNDPPIA